MRGLIVSHKGQRCGVWQFGKNLFNMLKYDGRIEWGYSECAGLDELTRDLNSFDPNFIIVNYHPATLPWLGGWNNGSMDWRVPNFFKSINIPTFCLMHMTSQDVVESTEKGLYDFHICLDPTIIPRKPWILKAPRFLSVDPVEPQPDPEIFTVGSFGFATHNKGFDKICSIVNKEFDQAIIRLNLPMHDDPGTVSMPTMKPMLDRCKAAITKPGIELQVTHDWLDNENIVKFLAGNTINAFLYDDTPGSGISSCTDFALAANKPIALSRTNMFRNFFDINPSIFVEDTSLKNIASMTSSLLHEMRETARPSNAASAWVNMIMSAINLYLTSRSTPDNRGFNKILDDRSRTAYQPVENIMKDIVPDIVAKKIPRANIQQAFALDTIKRSLLGVSKARILAVGSFEDTTIEVLKAEGYKIDEVDPNVNGMTLLDYYIKSSTALGSYDIIISVSVLEHVEDDEQFLRMCSEFVRPGGIGVFTLDFMENYKQGTNIPDSDFRMYTSRDINNRLMGVLKDCVLVDTPTWNEGIEDFQLGEFKYGFAGFVFQKLDHESIMLANVEPIWRTLLKSVNLNDSNDRRCV